MLATSSPSALNFRVGVLELELGIPGRETPADGDGQRYLHPLNTFATCFKSSCC